MKFGRMLIGPVALAGALFAQQGRPPMPTQYAWWESPVIVTSLNLSEAQTKQLNSIKASYVSRLMDLRSAANKAEHSLEEVYNQAPSDDLKADAAIDQYANARDNLTRTLSKMSLQMRNVLTSEQWQELQSRQTGRGGPRPGQGRGRRGTAPSSSSSPTANKVAPSISQK